MGPTQIGGLPAHVLIVHFVVVAVPLTGVLLVAAAVWPTARRRLGVALPVLALATLASVPVATHAGEWLERRVGRDPLVERHAELGDTLLPWAIGLFVVAAAVWAVERVVARASVSAAAGGSGEPAPPPRVWTGTAARAVLAALAVVVSVGALIQVYRIGESGSKAAWHDRVTSSTAGGGD